MAGGQELLATQIAGDLGHERAWNFRKKKEDNEGVPFYLLFAPVMYHGAWNQCKKLSWLADSSFLQVRLPAI